MEKRIVRNQNKIYLPLEIVFFLSFFIGIILANVLEAKNGNQYGIVNSYVLQQLTQTRIKRVVYLFYVLEIRLPVILAVLVLGMTWVYGVVHYLFTSWIGLSFGFLMVTSIMNLGLERLPFILMSMFPHDILYLLVYIAILKLQWQYHRGGTRRRLWEWITLWGMLAMAFLVGVLMEVYISPGICRKLL